MQDTMQNTPSDDIPEITKENFWEQFDRATEGEHYTQVDKRRLLKLIAYLESHRRPER